MISYHTQNTDFKLSQKRKISNWVTHVIREEGRSVGDINFILTDDNYLLTVNERFLGHDYYTDVITFDTSSYSSSCKDKISGDIFISIDSIISNSVKFDVPFLSELYRVIIHGVFHLLGYNDLSEEEIVVMRSKEERALKLISLVNE